MAKPVIPQGFVLDEVNTQQTGLPSGFVLDEPQELSQPRMSMGKAAFTTATNPLGFGDEIKAGIAAGVAKLFGGAATQNIDIGDLYREARTAERAKLQKARQDNPSITGIIEAPSNLARGAVKGLEEVGSGIYQAAADFGADFSGAKKILSAIRPDLKNEIESLTPQDISGILGEKAAQDSKATQQEGLTYKTGRFVGKVAPFVGVGGTSKAGLAMGGGLSGGTELMEDSSAGKRLGSAAVGTAVAPAVGRVIEEVVPAVQSLGIAVAQAPKKALQKITGIKPEAVKTFQELGIEPTLADVSNSAGLQNFIKDVPLAGKPITEALQKQVNDISGQIQNVISVKPKTYARTGKMIKEGAEEFEKFAGQRVSNLYDDLDRQILNETQEMTSGKLSSAIDEWSQLKAIENQIIGEVEVNAKSAALNSQFAQKQLGFWRNRTLADSGKLITMAANDAKDLNNLKKLIRKKENEIANYEKYLSPQQLKSVLATGEVTVPTSNTLKSINEFGVENAAAISDGVSRIIGRYKNIVDEAGNMPYPQLRMFRTTIGQRLQSPTISGDERAALNTIYSSLSEDMKDAVALYGGTKGLQAFDKANTAFKRKTEFIENIIDPVLKANTATKAYKKAISPLKEDATIAKNLMLSLKPIQQEYVRASIVRDMGLVSKAKQGAEADVFSPQKFMAEYSVLKKNGVEKHIFTPEQVTAYNRLNKVVELTKNTEQAGKKNMLLPTASLLSVGIPTTGIGLIPLMGGGRFISSQMMANPKFINWLAVTAQSTPKELPKQINRLSAIAAANPEIREDILKFVANFGTNNEEMNNEENTTYGQ